MLERSDKIIDSFNETINRLSDENLRHDKTRPSDEDPTVPKIEIFFLIHRFFGDETVKEMAADEVAIDEI